MCDKSSTFSNKDDLVQSSPFCVRYHYIHLAMLSNDEVDGVIETLCTSQFFLLSFCVYSRTVFILNE